MPKDEAELTHESVLRDEAVRILEARSGGLFVDVTLGLGGHTEAILDSSPDASVIGIDQDSEAMAIAGKRRKRFGKRVKVVQANFAEIEAVVTAAKLGEPNGIVADLGVSSLQFDSGTRGFSFRFNAQLDMRMDATSGETAAELLARASEFEIADMIYRYGEERRSRRIARQIVEKKESGDPVKTTFELADLVRRAVPHSPKDKTHPATRTFQALRIAVNHELDVLERFIPSAVDILKIGGVLAIITFHSLEDRIVKHAFHRLMGRCICPPRMLACNCGAVKRAEILTRKPILPDAAEIDRNPRSRSAKLRACRKINVNTSLDL